MLVVDLVVAALRGRPCLITGNEVLTPALSLRDPVDQYVLTAAIVGRCDVIVTRKRKDFLETTLTPEAIEAQDPDKPNTTT